MRTEQQARQAEALDLLRKWCPVGATIYRKLVYVNPQGTARIYSFYVIYGGELYSLDSTLADALGCRVRELKQTGRGIDTGFDNGENLVMALSYHLYHSNYELKTRQL